MGTLDHERVTSEKVGVVLWLLDRLDELAPSARLLRLRGEPEAARLHGRRAAELLAAGRPASEQSSMAKLAVAEELEPYYRAYRAADGFFVLTCLNLAQRRTTLRLLGLEDRFAADPQAAPASEPERAARARLVRRFEVTFAREPAAHWIRRLRAAGVPAGPVRTLDQLYDDPQALANGLVQDVPAPGGDTVRLLGGLLKVEGDATGARRGVPALGEHTAEVLGALGVHG